LLQYGYTIYALPPSTHPRAPTEAKQYIKTNYFHSDMLLLHTTAGSNNDPHNDEPATSPEDNIVVPIQQTSIESFCQWFYHVETLYPSNEYKMGYWADILAVAPLLLPSSRDNHYNSKHQTPAHTDLMKRILQNQRAQRRMKQ
jgi:hypothetical protein